MSRRKYHHGQLRTALIDAGLEMLQSKSVEACSLADAARMAGVSTAAPYRHFSDVQDFLAHLAGAGFERLRLAMEERLASSRVGSIDAIVGVGCAYVRFGAANPELFQLMWGEHRHFAGSEVTRESGKACYMTFIDNLALTMRAQGLDAFDVQAFGAPLWAMVHGFAALLVARTEMLPPEISAIEAQVARATRAYFDGMAKTD